MPSIRDLLRGVGFDDPEAIQVRANLETEEAAVQVQEAQAAMDAAYSRLYQALDEDEIIYLPDAPVRYQRWEGELYVSSTAPGSRWQSTGWMAPIVNRKRDRT